MPLGAAAGHVTDKQELDANDKEAGRLPVPIGQAFIRIFMGVATAVAYMSAPTRQVDRGTGFLLPPSVDEWLPERHLARFVVEVIDQLDLSLLVKSYRGSGSASYHPSVLLGLLVYGYATGVFSSRKLERATYDSVAFRFIAVNDHPGQFVHTNHDTIAAFRRRFLKEIETLFVGVLLLARETGMLQLGTVALDGTKLHANASRHSALSHGHASQIEAQLKAGWPS